MTTTKRKTKTAPKVAPAKHVPLKSRRIDDTLRNDIIHLATRNLYEEEIKAAELLYFTTWWALFRAANEHALNLWCCLPKGWQQHGHYQSRSHTLCAYTGKYQFDSYDVSLDRLTQYVKLPANFHAFPHACNTFVCLAAVKAEMTKEHPDRTYKAASEKSLITIKEAYGDMGKHKNARSETAWNLKRLLCEVKTTKRLIEVWPEGERFIPHPPVPVPLSQSLSVDVAALTAALKAGGAM
jgi:hypothetical protein